MQGDVHVIGLSRASVVVFLRVLDRFHGTMGAIYRCLFNFERCNGGGGL